MNEVPHNNGRGKKIFSLDFSGQSHPIFNVSVWKSHFNIKMQLNTHPSAKKEEYFLHLNTGIMMNIHFSFFSSSKY